MNKRKAAVEGRFYPSSANEIFKQIRSIEQEGRYTLEDLEAEQIFGAVLPHAGHVYSGAQTLPFFQLLQKRKEWADSFVIVHPNHGGYGPALAIDDSRFWINSIGEVPLDRELAEEMALPFDSRAHGREHSGEVIVPYLQYYMGEQDFSILPVSMGEQSYDQASLLAEKMALASAALHRNIMVLASCDFSHFLPPGEGRERDQFVVDRIMARDVPGVEEAVHRHHVSVCGYGPIMCLMNYAQRLDAEYKLRILARGHSGEVMPSPEVVNYISLILYR